MRTVGLLLVLALVLAGCGAAPGPEPGATEAPEAADPTAPSFLPSVRVAQHEGYGITGEPAVAAAPGGRFYVAAPYVTMRDLLADGIVTQSGPGGLWRSDDGRAFQRLGDDEGRLAGDSEGTGDTDVAVDARGRLHFVTGGGAGRVLHSVDGGATWTDGGAIDARGHRIDRPWIHARGDGGLLMAWMTTGDGLRDVAVRSSDDGGATWTEPTTQVRDVLQSGPPAASGDAAYVPYVDAGRSLHVLAWRDGAWTDAYVGHVLPAAPAGAGPVGNPVFVFPVVAVDAAGAVYLAWSEYGSDGSTSLAWTRSLDGGTSWSPRSRLTWDGNAVMPWIVAGDAGHVAVFFLAARTGGDPNVGAHEWYLRVLAASDADAVRPAFTAADVTPGPVHVGSICPNGTACAGYVTPFAGDRSLLDYFEAALDPDGGLAVAWTETHAEDGRNPEIRFARQSGGFRLVR